MSAVRARFKRDVVLRLHQPRKAPLCQLEELVLRCALVDPQHLLVDKENLLFRRLPDQADTASNQVIVPVQCFLDWLLVHAKTPFHALCRDRARAVISCINYTISF